MLRKIIVFMIVMILAGGMAYAAPADLPKTGQTASYATGDDGDLEMGVAWPSPRFINNGNGTVTDNLTGLIWLKNANCFGARTWANALNDANTLNSGECGLFDGSVEGDWRLPNRKELRSLVDYSNYNPALPTGHPFTDVQAFYYWSSTTVAFNTYYAWIVNMWDGYVSIFKDYIFFVWPVRAGQGPLGYPDISVTPNTAEFGSVNIGGTSDKQVLVRNDGDANLIIGTITTPSSPFSKLTDNCSGQTIAPNSTCTVTYRFAPTTSGNFSSNSNIPSNDPDENPVTISLNGLGVAETISIPIIPTGPINGTTGVSYSYTTGGSISSLGHSVQYQFDWGDGTISGWLPVDTTSASHPWSTAGTYIIKAQARCATDTSVLSSWSSSISVNIGAPITYTLTTNVSPTGAGTVTLNPPGGTYNAGTMVTLTATANSGYTFSSWTGLGPGDTSNGNIATIIMNSNKAITANFGPIPPQQYTLTISINPPGAGTVALNPTGGTYNAGTAVTLTATANSGYSFSTWSGDLTGGTNPTTITMNSNKNVTANFSSGNSTAIRDLPNCYTPSAPSTVTISVTPSGTTNSYAVEDIPPSGWAVSNINESGLWDSLNNKVKWGPFFDHNTRTLTYQVTPPVGETGSKTFSGTASFDGASVAIGGDSTIDSCSFHPADTDRDYRMGINEVTAYGSAWKTGQTWPTPPNPIPIEYVTNAGYLWRMGEVYHYDGSVNPPWVTGAASVQSIRSHAFLQIPMASGTGSATRTLPGSYEPSVAVNVSISVSPGQGTQVYAVEETPPNGWVVSDINENGQWDSVNQKVKWGLFFDSNNRTLTYKATPPVGETGAKTFSGTVSFDGNNVSIGGNQTIFSVTTGFLVDFDGDGATDVAGFHLPSDQFFTDYAGNLGQFGWGGSDSMPLIWDYDGDGKTDVSIYHIPTNQWFVKGVDNLGQFGWGGEESVPVPGDYNGDGIMERAFYHSPTNRWFVEGQDSVTFGWNGAECIPVPGDYDGDGKTDMVIYHIPSNQWFQYGVGNLGQFGWGGADCIPVPGDYNGDGKTEIAVYHIPTNQWFVKGMGNLGQYGWGGLESFPIPGDYNGDGVMERGFYRPGSNQWFIEGEDNFVWGWGGSEFMPITSSIAVYNWFRFMLGRFQ